MLESHAKAWPSGGDPHVLSILEFFDNGAVPLHVVDSDGIIRQANKAELALVGYPAEEYVGRNIEEFHADKAAISQVMELLQSGQTVRAFPAQLRTKDGLIRHVEITSSPHFENGRFVNTRCFTMDVTELVMARAEAAAKDDAMRQVLDSLPAAVYTTDREGRITYFNRAAVEFAGREPALGQDEWCVTYRLRTMDGAFLPHDQCPMAVALKENRAVRGVEALAERPDGTLVPFMPFPTPLWDAAGELVGAVNMLVDVSQRKEAEANQRLLLSELDHRVKNNLQMLHSLLAGAGREAENQEAQRILQDASRRVAAIAAAQQQLYRGTPGRSFSSAGLVKTVCDNASLTFAEHTSIEVDAEDHALRNDVAAPLSLIINELVTNAAKYATSGDDPAKIRVALRANRGVLQLRVQDSGPGFAGPVPTGRRASGLGLVGGLVRQLGGAFEVQPGPGAICDVTFPIALNGAN
jgi:PAS domain S-box-containing protein